MLLLLLTTLVAGEVSIECIDGQIDLEKTFVFKSATIKGCKNEANRKGVSFTYRIDGYGHCELYNEKLDVNAYTPKSTGGYWVTCTPSGYKLPTSKEKCDQCLHAKATINKGYMCYGYYLPCGHKMAETAVGEDCFSKCKSHYKATYPWESDASIVASCNQGCGTTAGRGRSALESAVGNIMNCHAHSDCPDLMVCSNHICSMPTATFKAQDGWEARSDESAVGNIMNCHAHSDCPDLMVCSNHICSMPTATFKAQGGWEARSDAMTAQQAPGFDATNIPVYGFAVIGLVAVVGGAHRLLKKNDQPVEFSEL